jgi:5-methyltetrahydropteroyltriglutamate--homocysteine methyltransferase
MLFPTTLVRSYPRPDWLIDHRSDPEVETPETVVRRALDHVTADRLVLAPDCGMKYLPREVAFGKVPSMVAAARILRSEHAREAR